MRLIALFTAAIILSACGGTTSNDNLLNDIAGVWRAQKDGAMITIANNDKKFSVLIGDDSIAGTVGDIDKENETVNLNVTLNTSKPGVWTFRRVWDNSDKTSYHLVLTLHDGMQDELSFVRKVSTDDLNRIANLNAKTSAGSISESVAVPNDMPDGATEADDYSESTTAETKPLPLPAQPAVETAHQNQDMSFAPSFDCNKASTGPERLICSNKALAEADVKMSQSYKAALSVSADKMSLKQEQKNWMSQVRNACSDATCMIDTYNNRLAQLSP